MWSIARRHIQGAEVEDAVQDVFISLWQSAARYDSSQAEEATFVAMIARRRIFDRLRKSRDSKRAELVEPLLVQESNLESSQDCRLALEALESLPEDRRKVVLLAIAQDLSHGEIAERTGLPLGTVKSHFRRGIDVVRARLGGAPLEPRASGGVDD